MIVRFTLNGEPVGARVMLPGSLLDVLRDELGLPGSKSGCEQGECGSCTVVLDDELVCACLVMAADVDGSSVTTVEGIAPDGGLNPVQRAMHEHGAVQCGFCTPGIVVAATELFRYNPTPSTSEIKEALAGNLCRCTGYGAIVRALESLAGGGT
jgi:carbon-monoxide dehydrogenase small subunit